MALKRLTIHTLMIMVAVVAITFTLIPIVFRTLYPNTYHHIYVFYFGDTVIFTVQF